MNSDVVRYVIEDGVNWEIGSGTYSAGTLTRTVSESSNADAAINLSGEAVVYVTAAAADIVQPSDLATVATTGSYNDLSDQPTLYSDTSVDTHLNTGTATTGQLLSWNGSDYDWVAVSGGATDIDGLSDGYSDGSSIGFGVGTLSNVSTAGNNIAIGVPALRGASGTFTGDYNIGLGYLTGDNLSSGSDNTFLGRYSGYNTSSGGNNFFAGYFAGSQVTTSSNHIAIGREALRGDITAKLTGSNNIGLGYQTGYDLSTGTYNFLAGYQAGANLTTGSNNVAIGNGALDAATTGGRNIAIGEAAMGLGVATNANAFNVAIGYQAGYDITTGGNNFLGGYQAGANLTTGGGNVAIGNSPLAALQSGNNNIALGSGALDASTAVNYTIAIGEGAMGIGNASGSYNTVFGRFSGQYLTTGGGNVLVGGFGAGRNLTTGSNNVILGNNSAGISLTTGTNNIVLGNSADASSATVSNEITLGNSSITRFRIPGAGIDNTSAALSGTTPSVDVGARDTYTLTTSGNTTFTFTGAPSSGQVGTFSLIITAGGTHTLTWPASVDWAGGTAPDAPASGEKDIYTFMTVDGGTTWYGFLAGDAMA